MADSVYISTNLNKKQLQFIQLLETYEIAYFSMQSIERKINHQFSNLNEILENLVNKNVLVRLERGKYANTQYANLYVLGSFIANGGVVAFWSALHLHKLTSRFPNKLFIKTTARKRNTNILGTPIKFVSVLKRKNIGISQNGYGDNAYPITNIEVTLIDCFDQPRYAGDFEDLIKAFAQAKLSAGKLIAYTKAYNNKAVTKRLGYLASLFHPKKLKAFIKYAQTQVNKKYNVLDAGGLEKGAFNSTWKLRLNVSEQEILNMVQSHY
ncbi:hypothetical protein [Lutibacter sp.]|uniref:type IV toxin-antitoxin system AbiEi family antitoxin domain-containing protein n=1 Tax=Lutibacter sp. TaxID=1925666 RepID=UPI0025BE4BE3|nr:hypothetical protein [Lutibacter sp.]MCF6168004.1 hypothetical protein [Lutibacter sp.]